MGSIMDDQERPWEARKRRGELMRNLRDQHRRGRNGWDILELAPLSVEDVWDLLCGMEAAFKPDEREGEGAHGKVEKDGRTAQCTHDAAGACSHCRPEWDPGGP